MRPWSTIRIPEEREQVVGQLHGGVDLERQLCGVDGGGELAVLLRDLDLVCEQTEPAALPVHDRSWMGPSGASCSASS